MDPGTIIAVAQLTGKILQSLKKYASSVKDADVERTRLASQLTAIQCVLDNIKSHLSAGDGTPGCNALSENLRVLLNDGGSIALYMATLRELMGELNEGSKKMRLRDKLLWPLREEKMKELLQKIGHYRIHFIMVYSLLTSERLAEVARTVASISEEQIRLRREAEVREKRRELEEQEREHEKMKEDIVKWLDPVDNGLKHATVAESRQEGTCAWLFKHPTYLQWMEADHGLLMIHGTPGFGKTTLASSVIDHVRCGSHPTINYHYCDFREPASVDVVRILRTILAQVVRYLPSGTDELRDLSRRARDRKEHLASGEIMALLERFSNYCPSHMYLVDALDECIDPSSLLEKLHALSSVDGAHVLVTCRSEYRITERLEEGDFRLCLMDEHDAIEGDIERYVVSQLSRTVHFKHFPDDLKNDIAAQLLSNANSMFRWVQCQLETLRRCRSSYAVENTLRHLPTSLNETYERILKAIDRSDAHDQHIARRALQWLVGSFRTLTVWEINDALLIQFGESQLSRGAFFDVRDVLDACGSLVYCENDTVRLSHATVKEFLAQTPWLLSASLSGPCDSISDALHRSLAMQCLAYLLLDVFEDGPCHTQEELNDRACDYPMYEYAARLWNRHVALVDADDTALYRAVMALIWERETAGRRQAMCQVYYTGGSVGMHYMVPVPWFWAAVISQTWLAKRMFLENPDWLSIEQLDGFDFEDRPLATAVTYHSLQLVTTLLQFGADVDEDRTRSPISYAADILATTLMFKDLRRSIVKQLLDYKADVTLVPVIVLNALSYTGETDIVLRFLQHGYQREWVDPVDGETPVHYAAKGDQLNLIGKLLDAGYDMDLISAGGRSALHHSLARKLPNMAERLLSCGVATWTLSTALLRQLSWAEGQCWYPRLIAPFRTHTATVPAGALRAITFLTKSYDTGARYPRSQIEDCLSCFSPIPPKSYFRYEATVAHENVPLLELNVHEKPMEQALFSYTVDYRMTHEKARKWFHHLKAGQTVQLTAKVPGGPTKRYTHISYREIRFFCRFDI
ncbi:hypothetical protein GGG16DRAFT_45732 [Schizophyllum commune]